MQLKIYSTVDELIRQMADYFIATADSCIADHGQFSVALSGGSSPGKLFALLAGDAYRNRINWTKVVCFFGDERYVPHTDDASNYKMANEVLLQPLNVPAQNIFPVNTSLSPANAAGDYWNSVKEYFGHASPSFDLILLGLGDNSHTASLFPHTPVLNDNTPSVKAVFLQDQQVYRITLNAPLINLAKHIAFLVYGTDKATAVHHVLRDAIDIALYPAQLIKPLAGELVWFLDEAAAKEL